MNKLSYLKTWIEIHIFKRYCLNCKNIEILDEPTRFMYKYFCDNAMDYDGLMEPRKTSVCKKFKRKYKDTKIRRFTEIIGSFFIILLFTSKKTVKKLLKEAEKNQNKYKYHINYEKLRWNMKITIKMCKWRLRND